MQPDSPVLAVLALIGALVLLRFQAWRAVLCVRPQAVKVEVETPADVTVVPPELEEANQERIVGLTIGLEPLVEIRKARLKQLGMSVDANYGLKDQVKAELEYAKNIFQAHPGWPVIDVTGRAIEETAVIILESLKEREEAKAIAKQIV